MPYAPRRLEKSKVYFHMKMGWNTSSSIRLIQGMPLINLDSITLDVLNLSLSKYHESRV